MAKIIQSEKTKYANNEYDNMPSLDYFTASAERLTQYNLGRVDLDIVREVCAKHGFGCVVITNTFITNKDCDVVICVKTDINSARYGKPYKEMTVEDFSWKREVDLQYADTLRRLHDCIHELDERTDLLFHTGNVGNVGLFGSHDVKRKSYSHASYLTSWRDIVNKWSPLIHDTISQLESGVYALASASLLKYEKD